MGKGVLGGGGSRGRRGGGVSVKSDLGGGVRETGHFWDLKFVFSIIIVFREYISRIFLYLKTL